LAIEFGVKIISVNKVISAQYYDNFIKNFAENNEKIRKISPLHKIIGKNNNNTFYGRLGMDPERLEEEILSNIDNTNKYEKIIENNGIYLGYTKKEKNISNVLISASITSKARIKLYRGMMVIINEGGRILYTDTDSIIAAFKEEKYKNVLNKQIGEVFFDSNLETTEIEDAVFAMPKTYALKYKNFELVKIKGFNETPSFNVFKKIFYSKKSIITLNTEWNKKDFIIKKTKKTKKTNLYDLDKRI
jgi:glutathione peroxidase-family protein